MRGPGGAREETGMLGEVEMWSRTQRLQMTPHTQGMQSPTWPEQGVPERGAQRVERRQEIQVGAVLFRKPGHHAMHLRLCDPGIGSLKHYKQRSNMVTFALLKKYPDFRAELSPRSRVLVS